MEEEAQKEYKAIAERRVRLGLVLGTLGERENIQVTDQEMQKALPDRASQFPGQGKQAIDFYRKKSARWSSFAGRSSNRRSSISSFPRPMSLTSR